MSQESLNQGLPPASLTKPGTDIVQHEMSADDFFAFLHIPKTAGVTLATLLDPYLPQECFPAQSESGLMNFLAQSSPGQTSKYHSLVGHFHYSVAAKVLPAQFIAVTMLRSPAERHLSHFVHLQHEYVPPKELAATKMSERMAAILQEYRLIRKMTLAEFIGHDEMYLVRQSANLQTRYLGAELSFDYSRQSLLAYLAERDQPPPPDMDLICRRLAGLAWFGLAEQFQESLFLLCYTFGWRPLQNNLRRNTSRQPLDYNKLDETSRQRLQKLNSHDLELYDFARQLFAARYRRMQEELLECYGRHAQVSQSLPLEHAAVFELLERHYQTRMVKRAQNLQQASPATQIINFEQPLQGASGWYPKEISAEHGAFRWSGPGPTSQIDIPLPASFGANHLQLKFRVLNSATEDILNSLRLIVNGQALALERGQDASHAWLFNATIPAEVGSQAPFLRLEFQVARTQAPARVTAEANQTDDRCLGVALNWIEVS